MNKAKALTLLNTMRRYVDLDTDHWSMKCRLMVSMKSSSSCFLLQGHCRAVRCKVCVSQNSSSFISLLFLFAYSFPHIHISPFLQHERKGNALCTIQSHFIVEIKTEKKKKTVQLLLIIVLLLSFVPFVPFTCKWAHGAPCKMYLYSTAWCLSV